jgi:flagellar protein FlaG
MNITTLASGTVGPVPSAQSGTAAAPPVAAVAAPAPAQAVRPVISPPDKAVQAAVEEIKARAQKLSPELEFKVDDATHRTVVTVRDTHTGDVIRQIPSEEVLWLAQHLDESPATLLDQKV